MAGVCQVGAVNPSIHPSIHQSFGLSEKVSWRVVFWMRNIIPKDFFS
jgi:hypothetical protein